MAAVKSRLQRARASLNEAAHIVEPTAPEARRLLDIYVEAFETAHLKLLTAVLHADARLELVPSQAWYADKVARAAVLAAAVCKLCSTALSGACAHARGSVPPSVISENDNVNGGSLAARSA